MLPVSMSLSRTRHGCAPLGQCHAAVVVGIEPDAVRPLNVVELAARAIEVALAFSAEAVRHHLPT